MSTRPGLPERIRLYMDKLPAAVAGSNGHGKTFDVAFTLVKGFALSVDDARPFLREYNARCQPPWSEKELDYKLRSAERTPDRQGRQPGWLIGASSGTYTTTRLAQTRATANSAPAPSAIEPARPEFDPVKLASFAKEWRSRASWTWLANRSPVEPALVSAEDFLCLLYHEGEHIVVFTDQESQGQALWPAERPPVAGGNGVWFLAQPTDGQKHHNPRTGGASRRSEESVTAWRYLVIENDQATPRDWIAALVQLPLPIAAIYTSGGRSIHALVQVDAATKADWDRERDALKPVLVTLGADPRALTAIRLTRLPGCLRGDKMQRLLYLNPQPQVAAICNCPPFRDGPASWLRQHERAKLTEEGLHDPAAPAGLLAALLYYGFEDRACAAAAAFWQELS